MTLVPFPADPTPDAVVLAYIAAMNAWELASWKRSREFRGTERADEHWPETGRALALIHATYLTPRRRVHAAQPSIQRPPAYDPAKEAIASTAIDGHKAFVETTRTAILGGGRYRYDLQLQDGAWLIDSLKFLDQGQWTRAIL